MSSKQAIEIATQSCGGQAVVSAANIEGLNMIETLAEQNLQKFVNFVRNEVAARLVPDDNDEEEAKQIALTVIREIAKKVQNVQELSLAKKAEYSLKNEILQNLDKFLQNTEIVLIGNTDKFLKMLYLRLQKQPYGDAVTTGGFLAPGFHASILGVKNWSTEEICQIIIAMKNELLENTDFCLINKNVFETTYHSRYWMKVSTIPSEIIDELGIAFLQGANTAERTQFHKLVRSVLTYDVSPGYHEEKIRLACIEANKQIIDYSPTREDWPEGRKDFYDSHAIGQYLKKKEWI